MILFFLLYSFHSSFSVHSVCKATLGILFFLNKKYSLHFVYLNIVYVLFCRFFQSSLYFTRAMNQYLELMLFMCDHHHHITSSSLSLDAIIIQTIIFNIMIIKIIITVTIDADRYLHSTTQCNNNVQFHIYFFKFISISDAQKK